MKVLFTEDGWADYVSWADDASERKLLRRINRLIADLTRGEGPGIGKPEILRGDLQGWMSSRINEEHRLVWQIKGDVLTIAQCRYHY